MTRGKLVLSVVVLLIVAVGLGFAWGASGRVTSEHALDDVKQQLDLAEARGHILEARVSLFNVNFGDAQRQLDDAKAPLQRARHERIEVSRVRRRRLAGGRDRDAGHGQHHQRGHE